MKKILGLLILAFALTGFSPTADACSVSGLTITPGGNNNYSFSASGCASGSEYQAVLKYTNSSGTVVKTTTQTKTAAGSYSFGTGATPSGSGPFTAILEITPRNYSGMCVYNSGQGKTNCKVGADIMYESCLLEGGGLNPLNLAISFLTPQQCLAQRNSQYSSCDATCSGYGNDGFKALTTVKKTVSYNPFYDNSTITTTPTTSSTRKINLFSQSTDASWSASSSASYYIKAEIKNGSGSIISTQTSSTVAKSGSTVAFPTKTYNVPSYGTYSVVQKLYREQGSTDLLVDTKTTTGLTFSCQQMAFYSADTKDGNVQDGQVGLRSRPRVASCHGSANLAINVKNSSGTSVYTTNVSVSSSSTDLSTQYRTLQFGALASGTYTVTQTLSKSGFTTQSRNDTLTVDFYDDSTITTTPTTSATRKINLFPNSTDVAFDASSNGSYYIKATIKNSAGATVSTQTSSTVANSGSTVALPTKVYTASSYDTYSVTQQLYREAGSTDTLVDTKTTTGLSFACPAMAINAADAKDGNVADGQVGLRSNPRVASCHGSATLAINVKNSSGASVYSTSTSVSSSGTELATVPKALQFGALSNGTYTVTQTLSKSGHTTQTRNDTLTVAFFDDSTITTTPTTSATRKINLFPNSTDVAFDASSNGSYYIQADVKNSSGTVLSTQTSSTVANSGATVALPTKVYTVPDYGTYEVVQRLYREAGSTDTLVDTKTTTGLSFGCPAMAIIAADSKDGNVQDGQVGLRSNPRVASCHGSASLAVTVKNSSGSTVYTNSYSVSNSSVEISTTPKTLQFGALPNGTYTVTQSLSKSGFATQTRNDTLTVVFFDDSSITTTPTTSGARNINLFPNTTDVAFDASSNGSYYIRATVKNSAGATVSTQTSSTVANSGSTVALPTKVYTAPTYGTFSVVQELFREAGSTDTLVDTKTTAGLTFACPAMSISNISSLDVDGSDGSHGFAANPAVASCHGSATLSVVIKNSSGTTVKTLANQTVSSSSTDPSVQSRTYTFDDLPDGTYSVVQTLTASGHTTATKTNSFVAQFFDNSTLDTTPFGEDPRVLRLFADADNVDANISTSSYGTYYIIATVRNSSGAIVSTKTATPKAASASTLNFAQQGFTLPSYDTYSVEQNLYREAGATDTLLDTKLTAGITFGCPAMSVSAISSIDVDGSDGSHGFTANPAVASCHGDATFNLVVKNGSGTTVYTGPAKIVSGTSVEPTIKPQAYTFADLPSGTYTVQQTLSASGHSTQTRNDPFVAEFFDNSQISTTPTTSAPRDINLFTQNLDAVIDSSSPGSYYITAEIKDGSGAVVSTQTSATVAGSSTALSLPTKTFSAAEYDTYSVTQRLYRENGATDTLLDTETTTGLSFACPAMEFGAITNVDSDKSDGTLSFGSRPRAASCHGNANLAVTMKNSSGTVVYNIPTVPVSTSSVELITQTKTYNTMDLVDGTYSIEQVLTSPGHDTVTQVDAFVVQFFDNSTVITTPTTGLNRTMSLFIDILDAEFDASRDGDYYIVADIKNSSDTVIKTLTTPAAANSGSNIQLAAANYVVPQYGNYEVEQRLYREQGATDLLVDTKTTTGLNFACPALSFLSADTKDGDVADGQVGLRSRPRAASCHGSASLAIDVKNSSGTTVYTTTVPVSTSNVDPQTIYKTLQFGALADGTYTINQTLSASGFTSAVQNDTLTVAYYDDSTITTTPVAEPTRKVRLFTEPYDVDVDSSSDATYYISAEIRDASDTLIANEVSTTNSVSSDKVAIPLLEYTVPEYGLYKITQKLYRENGATDDLIDTKQTELSFQCPAFSFQPITNVDTDKSDGTLAFTSRPGVASCHGAANLEIVIKDESGSVVYSRATEPATSSSVELTYLSKVYNTMDLDDGTYTVEQTLTASGIPSKQQIDTFIVDFFDSSKLNTVPVEGANHVIDLFSQDPDVDFDSSSVADYYIKTTVKDSSDATIHTESTANFTASGPNHSIVTKPYAAPDYENYTVIQELFRKGTTNLLVHSRTTSIEFACPAMSIYGIQDKDTDGSDGHLGFTAKPRVANCHVSPKFSFVIKNSSGTTVHSSAVTDVNTTAVDFEIVDLPFTFDSLPDGDYSVEQRLESAGSATQTRTDVFTVDFWDNSTLTTTPVTEAVRKILLNNDPQDVAVDASSLGEYYIVSKIFDADNGLVTTQTSSTALASNDAVDYSVQPFIVPDYGTYSVVQELYRERGTTDALLDTVTTGDLSFSCPNPVFNNLLVTDIDGTDGNHAFTVRPELAACNGSATLATVIKDDQGATVLTLPNKTINPTSIELALSLQAYTFDALQGGDYTVTQTLSGAGFDTITRNDQFTIVCEDPTLDGISLIDTDGTDGKHGFTVNGKLSSCNAPSDLTVTVKNESGTTVYTTSDLVVNSSALTLQSFAEQVEFNVLPPGNYTVSQSFTTSNNELITRVDPFVLTCNVFQASWGDPSSSESPQDEFNVNALVTATDECNGTITANLEIKDGSTVIYSSNDKTVTSGASANGDLAWNFAQSQLDDTTLDIKLTLTNGYGDSKILTDQLELTCPSLFTPNNFSFNQATQKFSLNVAAGRACNGQGTINLSVNNPADNNAEIGIANSTVDLTGATSAFTYDLPITLPQNPAGTYAINGVITDAKGSIKYFTHFFDVDSQNVDTCSIDSISPFDFDDTKIGYTFATSNCTNAVQFDATLVIKDDQGIVISTTTQEDVAAGSPLTFDSSLMPTNNGLYVGELTIDAGETISMCQEGVTCLQQSQLIFESCMRDRSGNVYECQLLSEGYLEQCERNCNGSGSSLSIATMTVTSQHLVYDDSSKIVTVPSSTDLTISLFDDLVDVQVITSSYGDYTLRATISDSDSNELTVVTQGPKTATSASLDFETTAYSVPEFGSYQVRQELLRDGEIIDIRQDMIVLDCPNPTLNGLANIDLDSIDGFIDFDVLSNYGKCNGASTLKVEVLDGSEVVFNVTPEITFPEATNVQQTEDTEISSNIQVPTLTKGSYIVKQTFTDSIGNEITREDDLTIACGIFQAGLNDPAITEPTDNNFTLGGQITTSSACNGNLTIDMKVELQDQLIFEADTQTIPSNVNPVPLDYLFDADLDGVTLDVTMRVESDLGDVEVYTQQVEIGCPSDFTIQSFQYDQQNSNLIFGLGNQRGCNGMGTIEYTITDPTDNDRVIHTLTSPIDLSGSTNQFIKYTELDLPANDVVGTYDISGTITDANGVEKPFFYNFDLICPPLKLAGRIVGSPPPALLLHNSEVGKDFFTYEIGYETTDVCHVSVPEPEQFTITIKDGQSDDVISEANFEALTKLDEAENTVMQIKSTFLDKAVYGRNHNFVARLEDPTGTLFNQYSGVYSIACPIGDMVIRTEYGTDEIKATITRDSELACQEELSIQYDFMFSDGNVVSNEPLGSVLTERTSADEVVAANNLDPDRLKELGGKNVSIQPKVFFYDPYDVSHLLNIEYWRLPCIPADITAIHSMVQNRAKDYMRFSATYSPVMTCNGITQIYVTIYDENGTLVADADQSVNSDEEVFVDFETSYLEMGTYTAKFKLIDSLTNITENEFEFTPPCSEPGVVDIVSRSAKEHTSYAAILDFPSCNFPDPQSGTRMATITIGDQSGNYSVTPTDYNPDWFLVNLPPMTNIEPEKLKVTVAPYISTPGEFDSDAEFTLTFHGDNVAPKVFANGSEVLPGVIPEVEGLDDIQIHFPSHYELPDETLPLSSLSSYPNADETLKLLDISMTSSGYGHVKFGAVIYDYDHKSFVRKADFIIRNVADGQLFHHVCTNAYMSNSSIDAAASLSLPFDTADSHFINTLECNAALPALNSEFELLGVIATKASGYSFFISDNSVSTRVESFALGTTPPSNAVKSGFVLQATSTTPRYVLGFSAQSNIIRPVQTIPLPNGRYRFDVDHIFGEGTVTTVFPIEFDYSRPVRDIEVKIPEGISTAIDALIPRDTASYLDLDADTVDVDVVKISGEGSYLIEGIEVGETPVPMTLPKSRIDAGTYQLLVKSNGNQQVAKYRVTPKSNATSSITEVTVKPYLIEMNLKNHRDEYFLGDPVVKVWAEKTTLSNCTTVVGGAVSNANRYAKPLCAIKWDTTNNPQLAGTLQGKVLRGSFSSANESVPYEYGIVYTSPDTLEAAFYPVGSGVFSPTILPPGDIRWDLRQSRSLASPTAGLYYTPVGLANAGYLNIIGDIPGLDVDVTLDGVQKLKSTTSKSARITLLTEATSVYQTIPVTVKANYQTASEGAINDSFNLLSIPARTYVTLTQPQSAVSGQEIKVIATINAANSDGFQPYNPTLQGDWEIELFELDSRRVPTSISSRVSVAPDGTVEFTLNDPDAGSKRYIAIAYAKPPAGIEYSKEIKSRTMTIRIADGSPIEGHITTSRKEYQAPFAGTIRFISSNVRRYADIARIDWYVSNDDGATFSMIADESTRLLPFNLEVSEKRVYKARIYNIHSGEVHETGPLPVQSFNIPQFQLVGDTSTFVSHPAKLKVNVTNGVPSQYKWEVKWGRYGEVVHYDTQEINLQTDSIGYYYVKVYVSEVGAPDIHYAKRSKTATVVVNAPNLDKPRLTFNKRMELGVPTDISVIRPSISGGSNDTLQAKGSITLPNGQIIPDNVDTFSYTPQFEDMQDGRLHFGYTAWIEGYQAETTNTYNTYSTGWEYVWPNWTVTSNVNDVEAPGRIRFSLNQLPFTEKHHSLDSEVISINWSATGGDVAYENQKRFDVVFGEPGTYTVRADVTDTRGNASAPQMDNVALTAGMPLDIALTAGNYLTDWVAPTKITLATVIKHISSYDDVDKYQYYLNGAEQLNAGQSSKGTVDVTSPGEHTFKVKVTTEKGEVAEKTVVATVIANVPPVCNMSTVSDGALFHTFYSNCQDEDSRIVQYEWIIDGVQLEGSSHWLRIDNTQAGIVNHVKVTATDSKGGVTESVWTR